MKNILILFMLFVLLSCGKGSDGAAGPTGPTGATGPTGNTGAAGSSGQLITVQKMCSKVDAGSGISLVLQYEHITLNNGDHFVTCNVSDDYGARGFSYYYKSNQVGATNGSCLIFADIDAGSAGYWTFTSQSGVTKAVYNDTPSAHNNYTYTFASGDCVDN